MGKVPDRDLALLVDVRQERAFVVDTEIEDAVLVGKLEAGAKDSRILGCEERFQV